MDGWVDGWKLVTRDMEQHKGLRVARRGLGLPRRCITYTYCTSHTYRPLGFGGTIHVLEQPLDDQVSPHNGTDLRTTTAPSLVFTCKRVALCNNPSQRILCHHQA